ncbi:Alpha carbonic anhydrase 7 [Dichanthelium oligosanthes]|uniref:Carbonic anhydrase n=1 Tax=Dichanthelium oligosanthes TaxID=888268 RepID=A0A1E5W1C3_9POAL|nr:Alpha carbonic anhydrase 7 [Dichanthelium oligosanthes]
MVARRRNDGAARAASSPALALAVLVVFAFCARSASAVGSAPHAAFSYKEGDPDGPEKWSTLQKDWALCDSGTEQSPIDIAEVVVSKDLAPLEQTYRAGAAVVQNRGHDFMLNWTEGNGKLTLNGKEYTLLQVHWHAPSEHTVNGTRFDAEMHMVHEDSTKEKTVVSVLFSSKAAGKDSKLLDDLRPYFEKLTGKQNATEEVKGPIDPADWIDKASGYYRYEGSLTTPPCTEGVIWTILSKVADASAEQIDSLKSENKVHRR